MRLDFIEKYKFGSMEAIPGSKDLKKITFVNGVDWKIEIPIEFNEKFTDKTKIYNIYEILDIAKTNKLNFKTYEDNQKEIDTLKKELLMLDTYEFQIMVLFATVANFHQEYSSKSKFYVNGEKVVENGFLVTIEFGNDIVQKWFHLQYWDHFDIKEAEKAKAIDTISIKQEIVKLFKLDKKLYEEENKNEK